MQKLEIELAQKKKALALISGLFQGLYFLYRGFLTNPLVLTLKGC
jgi:hypothetical protein